MKNNYSDSSKNSTKNDISDARMREQMRDIINEGKNLAKNSNSQNSNSQNSNSQNSNSQNKNQSSNNNQ